MFKSLGAMIALMALAGCAIAPQSKPSASGPPSAGGNASAQGALALFPILDHAAGKAENVVYSPASVEQAFGMLQLGASGETLAQLQRVLPAPADARSLENAGPDVRVKVANALWLDQHYRFRDSFLTDTQARYDAVAERVDFTQADASARRINQWADKATEGLIPQIVEPKALQPGLAAILTNALFFEGKWQSEFVDGGSMPFLFGDGRDRPFDMMAANMARRTIDREGWRALRLPYRDGRYAMDVIMPAGRNVMAEAPSIERIEGLAHALDGAKEQLVAARLPRFEISFEAGLIPALKAIGLTLPFCDSCSDFAAMLAPGEPPVVVGDVRHLARLQVFDEGTRAAAVTTISMIVTSAPVNPVKPVEFIVDRPFVAVIRDLKLDRILFVARIAAPEAVARPKEE